MVMIIPIQVHGQVETWSLIELQGELIAEAGIDGVEIGKVEFLDGKPVLQIGYHVLTGEIKTLSKPFAVLQKKTIQKDGFLIITACSCFLLTLYYFADSNGSIDSSVSVAYEVVGIARTHLLFKERPKPVIKSHDHQVARMDAISTSN